ncbi:MAG: NAD(P)/FAD-dependent oxidoreductase [Proteobacteria bacterium]|nr:NAD(P)/FAD-dependent oxidoreductase [Pseudomonadota bacterium]MBU1710652.1 NAD(P)/FAD-dependent oxidoreductase [Pseudomonadota bacterium]
MLDHKNNSLNNDAIVIGSGISGLTSAALLAKKGCKVVILEKNRKPGGALRRFKRQGVPFDVGFHYTGGLGPGEILNVLWEYIGVLPRLTTQQFPAEGCDCVTIKETDKTVRCFFSYERLKDELQRKFPEEATGIAGYLETLKDICKDIPFYNLDIPITPFLRGHIAPMGRGFAEALGSFTRDPALHAVLSLPAFLHGVPPANVSIGIHAMVAHGYYSGAYAVDNGGQGIVDAFIPVLEKYGVEIKTGCAAEEILINNNAVAGVKTREGELLSSNVIFTGHPTSLLDIVPHEIFRPIFVTRLKELKNTGSMFAVFGMLNDAVNTNELCWENYYNIAKGFDSLTVDRNNPADSSLMLTAPGMRDTDADLSGASKSVILMRPADWSETEQFQLNGKKTRSYAYANWKEQATQQMISKAKTAWGAIGDITPLAAGSPLTFQDELGAPEGSVYGVLHSMDQFITGARTRLPGLYLSGQSTLMNGVMGSSLAGFVTAGEILGLEKLWDEVRTCR